MELGKLAREVFGHSSGQDRPSWLDLHGVLLETPSEGSTEPPS